MACININSTVLSNLNNDNITASLNQIIDRELAKDVSLMNTALIDECVCALIEIEKEKDSGFNALVPLLNSNEFIKSIQPKQSNWKNLNVFARASIIAALLAASAITANAAYRSATGIDLIENFGTAIHSKLEDWNIIKSEEETANSNIHNSQSPQKPEEPTTINENNNTTIIETTTAPTEQTAQTTTTTTKRNYIEQLGDDEEDDEETTTQTTKPSTTEQTTVPHPEAVTEKANIVEPEREPETPYVSALEAKFDNFKYNYIYGEELSYEGLTLTAVYNNGDKRAVALGDCDYTKSVNMNTTANYTLRVIYEKCVVKIDITVRPDEETRGAVICENDDFEYFLSSKGAYITKYKGSNANIMLDETDGNSVYAIGAEVFKNSDIQSISAKNAKKIFNSAFEGCKKLKSAELSSELSYLGSSVFKDSGIEELTLSDNITEIPESLCENCSSLTKITLGKNTSVIGGSAFSECEALDSVLNTENIKKAKSFAFYNCTLAQFDSPLPMLEKAKEYAFAYCNNIDFGKLNDGISEIGQYAFAYCTKLTEVNIPSGFTKIPEGAFRGAHISTLTLPEGLKVIEDYAFMSTEFRELTVPNSVEKIGTYALYSVRMRNISLGENVCEMGENAVFKTTRLNMNVYANSVPYEYAIENDIKYTIIQ